MCSTIPLIFFIFQLQICYNYLLFIFFCNKILIKENTIWNLIIRKINKYIKSLLKVSKFYVLCNTPHLFDCYINIFFNLFKILLSN